MKFNALCGASLILVLNSVAFSKLTSPSPENVTHTAKGLITQLPTKTPVVANCKKISIHDSIDDFDYGQMSVPTVLNFTAGISCWNITTATVTNFYFSLTAHNATGVRRIILYDAENTWIWGYPNRFCSRERSDCVNTGLASSPTSYVIVQTSILGNYTWIKMTVQAMPQGQLPGSSYTVTGFFHDTLTSLNYPFSFPAETRFSVTIHLPGDVHSSTLDLNDLHVEGTNAVVKLTGPGVNAEFNNVSDRRHSICLSNTPLSLDSTGSFYTLTFQSNEAQDTGATRFHAYLYTYFDYDCGKDTFGLLSSNFKPKDIYIPPNIGSSSDKSNKSQGLALVPVLLTLGILGSTFCIYCVNLARRCSE